jgi:hypothetical protein
LAIVDSYPPATIIDQTLKFQLAGCPGYAGALYAEHHPKEFLRQQELIGLHAIMRHQQPAATSLFDVMKVVTGRRQRYLVEKAWA